MMRSLISMVSPLSSRSTCVVVVASLLALVSACGGTQPTDDAERTGPIGLDDRGDADPGEEGTQEAEVAEDARLQQAQDRFAQAVSLFESSPPDEIPGDRIRSMLEEVLDLVPEHAVTWFNVGVLEQRIGNRSAAREAYERATELDPEFARGLANLGFLALVEGDQQRAREYFDECLERNPLEAGCNINLAVLHRLDALEDAGDEAENTTRAIERLRFALGGEARNAAAYATLARIYFDLGRIELARIVCENAILLGIESAELHNRLGLIALEEDDVITAYHEFQQAVRINPTHWDAHMNIGAMALSFRDFEAARDAFGLVLSDDEENLDARLSFGVALQGLDLADDAEVEFRAILDQEPGHLGALFNLGVLHQENFQDYGAAISYYEEFLQAGGDAHEMADEAVQRIEVCQELLELMGDSGDSSGNGTGNFSYLSLSE